MRRSVQDYRYIQCKEPEVRGMYGVVVGGCPDVQRLSLLLHCKRGSECVLEKEVLRGKSFYVRRHTLSTRAILEQPVVFYPATPQPCCLFGFIIGMRIINRCGCIARTVHMLILYYSFSLLLFSDARQRNVNSTGMSPIFVWSKVDKTVRSIEIKAARLRQKCLCAKL